MRLGGGIETLTTHWSNDCPDLGHAAVSEVLEFLECLRRSIIRCPDVCVRVDWFDVLLLDWLFEAQLFEDGLLCLRLVVSIFFLLESVSSQLFSFLLQAVLVDIHCEQIAIGKSSCLLCLTCLFIPFLEALHDVIHLDLLH